VRRLREMFKADPDRKISKGQYLAALVAEGHQLGPRPFGRVWDRATEQSPDRRKPGSKPGSRKSKRDTD
jgi:hypothetical protein